MRTLDKELRIVGSDGLGWKSVIDGLKGQCILNLCGRGFSKKHSH